MRASEVLVDGFTRVQQAGRAALAGLTPEQASWRPDGHGNSVAWLVWHLTRVQDGHVADAFDAPQVWTSGGWAERFALPLDPHETGYGHTSEQVAAVQVASVGLLREYLEAVHEVTVARVAALADADLDRVVDESWDPPVTLGVRLVSVIADDLQHAGQAAYVRGLLT
ncbi:DUF664 domain-containing protein [Cellulomonas sp. P22]|uniref:mycothiol transferase n=1 Tax=Cellulomonas sp. P22 TaxID=3373189 RepID=UPI0037AE296D